MNLKIEFKNIYSTRDYLNKVYNITDNDCTEVTILGERYDTLKDYLYNVYKSFYDKNVIVYYNISIHNEGYISWCNEKGICCSAKVSYLPPRKTLRGKLSSPLEWISYTMNDSELDTLDAAYKAFEEYRKAVRRGINMTNIELVIKIPEDAYNYIKANGARIPYCKLIDIIKNGTLLPKGHGDLIDKNELLTVTDYMEDGTERCYVPYVHIKEAETIIEADRGEEK